LTKNIYPNQVVTNLKFEKGINIDYGITDEICGSKSLIMGHTTIPAGSRNQRHYHINAETGWFVLKGRLLILMGEGENYREEEIGPGCFSHNAKLDVHGFANLSETEDAEVVFAYSGVPNINQSGTVFVEDDGVVESYKSQREQRLAKE
jgi:uncharacterized RmlC-like cupin family protein